MANPHKGELSFEDKIDGTTYTLHFGFNAMCELEDKLDRSFVSISNEIASGASDPDKLRMATLRAVFWAGLRDHHPDIDVNAAGDLILRIGGLARAMELLSEAFVRAFPTPESKDARPPKGGQRTRNGIGAVS